MVINSSTKQCTKCKESKPLNEFNKRKGKVSGVKSQCKVCESKRSKQWRLDNREADLEYKKQYYIENREAQLEYAKQYHLDNREVRLEYNKQYHKEVIAPQRIKLLIRVRRIIARLPEHRYSRFADIIHNSSKLSDLCWYSDIEEFVTTHNTKGI